jgi:hypothetical protein
MRFVEIIPPEAGKLDEHKAVVELTADDLERLRRHLMRSCARDAIWTEPDAQLRDGLAEVQRRLFANAVWAAAPAGEDV